MIDAMILTMYLAGVVDTGGVRLGPVYPMDVGDIVIMMGLGLIAGTIIGTLLTDTLRHKHRK